MRHITFAITTVVMFCALLCHGQADTSYYDSEWSKISKDRAAHFCTFKKEDDLYAAKCFYIENRIRSLSGYSRYKDSLVLEGYTDYFNLQGKKIVDAFFQSNIPSGIWEYYRENVGKPWRTITYKYGTPYETNTYYENGQLKRHEIHDTLSGRVVNGASYNEEGKEIPLTPSEVIPGPGYDLLEFIKKTMHYPREARYRGITGKVKVKFVVDKDGSIKDAKIVKSLFPALDAEALRIISLMPPWKPGQQDGENVSLYFTLPIQFEPE